MTSQEAMDEPQSSALRKWQITVAVLAVLTLTLLVVNVVLRSRADQAVMAREAAVQQAEQARADSGTLQRRNDELLSQLSTSNERLTELTNSLQLSNAQLAAADANVQRQVAAQDKAQQALKSVKERLTCDWGTAILAPAYSTYRIELGEISSYPRGYKENGGIFCHNNPWISIANAIAGNDDEAFAVYQRNCPAYVEDKSDVRKVEPYVYCQMVAGPEAATPGEGKNSWLTGTAAWTFVDVSQYLLGVRPTLDGLAIEPHLPERFDQLTVTRVFRGVTYRIAMKRTGERTVSVDGAKIGGNVVPALSDAKSVDVEVTF